MIRLRPAQLDAFREEMRVALAARLARRGVERYPEKLQGRDGAEVRAEARRVAAVARERGFLAEQDVTLFYDLSMELGPGFEQGPSGAWARQLLRERSASPHARIEALRGKALQVEEWDPYRERVRSAVTGRVTRLVGKGPPRRFEVLRARREALDRLAASLRSQADGDGLPREAAERAALRRRVEEAGRAVGTELALRRNLETLAARARAKADAERTETDPSKRGSLAGEVSALGERYERVRRALLEELSEDAPRPGSADAEDPCVARVETDAVSERETAVAEAARKLRVARALTVACGGADGGDRIVVAVELSRLPGELLDRLRSGGTRVVACRGSIVDHRRDLAEGRPRGWPPGFGWSDVTALWDGARNEVVVATLGHGPGKAGNVPRTGDGPSPACRAVHAACRPKEVRVGSPSPAPRSGSGFASLDADGAIVLDLHAGDGRELLGDGRVVCPPSHPRHREMLGVLGPLARGESKPVPPWPALG